MSEEDLDDIQTFDWSELDGKTVNCFTTQDENVRISFVYCEETDVYYLVDVKEIPTREDQIRRSVASSTALSTGEDVGVIEKRLAGEKRFPDLGLADEEEV